MPTNKHAFIDIKPHNFITFYCKYIHEGQTTAKYKVDNVLNIPT